MSLADILGVAGGILGVVNSATGNSISNTLNSIGSGINSLIGTINTTTHTISSGVQQAVNTVNSGIQQIVSYPPVYQQPPVYQPSQVIYQPPQIIQQPIIQFQQPTVTIGAPATVVGSQPAFQLPNANQIINNVFGPNVASVFNNLSGIVQQLSGFNPQTALNNVVSGINSAVNNINSTIQNGFNILGNFANSTLANVYGSTSNVLGSIGVNLGQYASLIDGSVRAVIDRLGLTTNQAVQATVDAYKATGIQYQGAVEDIRNLVDKFIKVATNNVEHNEIATKEAIIQSTQTQIDTLTANLDGILKPIAQFILKVIFSIWNDVKTFTEGLFSFVVQRVEKIKEALNNANLHHFKTFSEFTDSIFGAGVQKDLLWSVLTLASAVPIIIDIAKIGYEGTSESLRQLALSENPVTLLAVNDYLEGFYKDRVSAEDLQRYLGYYGISREQSDLLAEIKRPFYDEGTIRELVNRDFISEHEGKSWLAGLGYRDFQITDLVKLWQSIPNPSDLTRMADKHVFDNVVDPSFGQYTEYPKEYIEHMNKWGYSEDWSKKIWASHWSLPSVNQILEMFQRGFINQSQVDTYLNLTDYMPFFRDKLVSLSFNPVTRVDIRRLFKTGIYTQNEVLKAYRNLGYSPDDSLALTKFTVSYEDTSDEDEFSKLNKRVTTGIESAYKSNHLTRQEARDRLLALGHSTHYSDTVLNLIELEKVTDTKVHSVESYITKIRTHLVNAYSKGMIDENEVRRTFSRLGLSQTEIDKEVSLLELDKVTYLKEQVVKTIKRLYVQDIYTADESRGILQAYGFNLGEISFFMQETSIEKLEKLKKPTEKELTTFYKKGIISRQIFASELSSLGYADTYILWIVASAELE